jgi:hypothetical protein
MYSGIGLPRDELMNTGAIKRLRHSAAKKTAATYLA